MTRFCCFVGQMLYKRLGVNHNDGVIYVTFFSSVQHDTPNVRVLGNFRLQLCTHTEMLTAM